MRLLLRPWRLIPFLFLLGLVIAAVVLGPWLAAQARAVVVLSTTLETPVLTWAVKKLTDEPRVVEVTVAGVPATLARPGDGDGPWPAVVFVNGATPLGRREPDVQDLARGLARAGHLVLVPDLPGLARGELSERTLETAVRAALSAASRPDASDGEVALVGVSVGGTLALLAAEDPRLADRVSLVAAIAPYTDLKEVLRLATTGHMREGGRFVRYRLDPYIELVAVRSLVGALPAGTERTALAGRADGLDDDDPDPIGTFLAGLPDLQDANARAVRLLLGNRDPARFDSLYAQLPAALREQAARFSPLRGAGRLRARVELASAPEDKYFPVSQSQALVAAAPDVRLTVTDAFAHAVPRPSLGDPADMWRFNLWAVRALRGLRA